MGCSVEFAIEQFGTDRCLVGTLERRSRGDASHG